MVGYISVHLDNQETLESHSSKVSSKYMYLIHDMSPSTGDLSFAENGLIFSICSAVITREALNLLQTALRVIHPGVCDKIGNLTSDHFALCDSDHLQMPHKKHVEVYKWLEVC